MAEIVHSQMLKLYAGPRSISGSFGASPSQAVVTAYLSQPSCVLSANAEGVVEDYAPASTTIVVEVSGRTDTSNWTISTAKSPSVGTVSVTGATVSVSGLTDDAGWVDITASKTGYEPVTRRFTLAKVRQKGGVRVATTLPANPSEVGGELAIFLDVADPALRGMYGWSGTAWVKTGELLNGSVTADKLAADAIQATKFASGIEPVAIVNLLPNVVGYTGPKLVFLTTDNKLYRYTGSSWVKELPAEDLTGQLVADQLASNSVTTGKIQAGAVTTDQLAARAVTASKMVLTDTSNIYPDYDILDSSFYSGGEFSRVASASFTSGAYSLRIAASAFTVRVESQWFQVEPSAEYLVEVSCSQSIAEASGAAAVYVEYAAYDGGASAPMLTRGEQVLRRANTTSAARADLQVTTASNERRARLVFVREAGGTGVADFGGPVIRRRNNGKLIVDGSIVATKIATDAVQTHHLLAGAVTAEKLAVNKLSAITADMGDVTAGTFTLSSTGYIRGGATSFSAGTGFWMGYHDGRYKWRAGIPGSSGFEWDGLAFNVYGPDGSVTISSGVVDWAKISGETKPQDGATRNVFRGDWGISTSYAVGDIVLKDGNGWSCILAHASTSGNQPPASGSGNTWWTLYAVKGSDGAQGLHALTVLVPNNAHTLPAASDGVVASYTGSGTTIQVFEGTTALSAVSSITANGQFTVGTPTQLPASTITVGARSYSGTTATVAQHSAMVAGTDSVVVTYPITVRRTDGTTVTLSATQTLTKSKAGVTGAQGPAGPAVVVTANRALSFTATDGALDGSQANIVLTAAVSGIASPTYAWTFSGLQTNPTASTTSSQTITAAQFGTSKSAAVTCTVNGTYKDQVTIVRLEKSTAEAGATVGATAAQAAELQSLAKSGANLVANAAFASTVGGSMAPGWTLYNNGGVANVQWWYRGGGMFGTDAQRVKTLAATTNTFGVQTNFSLGGGVRYVPGWGHYISFYARAVSGEPGFAGLTMSGLANNDLWTNTQVIENPPLLNGVYQRYVFYGVANAGADLTAGSLWITANGSKPANASLDICCVQVEAAVSGAVTAWKPGYYDVVGAGRPITPSNVTTYIANAAIGNAQFGGNLWSTNWNYAGGTGWLLDRNGNFYGNNVYARGDIEASSLKVGVAMVDSLNLKGTALIIPMYINAGAATWDLPYVQGTWQYKEMLKFSFTVSATGTVRIDFGPYFTISHWQGHANYPDTITKRLEILLNDSVIETVATAISSGHITATFIGTRWYTLSPGTYTFVVKGSARMADGGPRFARSAAPSTVQSYTYSTSEV